MIVALYTADVIQKRPSDQNIFPAASKVLGDPDPTLAIKPRVYSREAYICGDTSFVGPSRLPRDCAFTKMCAVVHFGDVVQMTAAWIGVHLDFRTQNCIITARLKRCDLLMFQWAVCTAARSGFPDAHVVPRLSA